VTVGVYPGSFDPPTVAHLAIAQAAWRQAGLDRVDLVVSTTPLGKPEPSAPSLADRVSVLEAISRSRPWLGVRVTADQLLADIATAYDVLVLGADKWAQVVDPAWYGSVEARDAAVARLPRLLVAARPPFSLPAAEQLTIPEAHLVVSSTAARRGRTEWLAPEAAAALSADPRRFAGWLAGDDGDHEGARGATGAS
jgi:nicotinic acid mononucleotide adenylyltransferase